MATQAQINANRINGARSSGPTSEAGKQRSARNSLRHGIYAGVDAITTGLLGENHDEVQSFVDDVVGDLAPRNTLERVSAMSIAAKAIGQLRVSRLVQPLVEGVQMTMEENMGNDEHRWRYEFAQRLLRALDIADAYDHDTDIAGVEWFDLERQLWFQVEPDPALNPSRPVFVDRDGNRREPVGDEQLLANFNHTVNQRFECWERAREWAEEMLLANEPGAAEESRRLRLAEAQRIMTELERIAALQERADRSVTRALAAHESIRAQTVDAAESEDTGPTAVENEANQEASHTDSPVGE